MQSRQWRPPRRPGPQSLRNSDSCVLLLADCPLWDSGGRKNVVRGKQDAWGKTMQTLLNAEGLNCLAAAWSGGGVKSASSRQVPGIGGVAGSGFRIDGSCANKFFNVT